MRLDDEYLQLNANMSKMKLQIKEVEEVHHLLILFNNNNNNSKITITI